MQIARMPLEDWFDNYQFVVDYDLGESAVRARRVGEYDLDLSDIALRYGHHQGHPELRAQIAEEYDGLCADDVLVTCGASEAIGLLSTVLLSVGSRCVIEHPTYPTSYEIPRMLGAAVDLFRLRAEDEWVPDLDRLSAQVGEATPEFVSISHPNNPTGSHLDEQALDVIVRSMSDHDVRIVSDETYRELSYGNPLPPVASLSPSAVSISTMSKCFGVPGLRIGWIATRDRDLLRQLVALREYTSITNNTVGELLALHILSERERHLAVARRQVSENLKTVSSWIEDEPGLAWCAPRAGVVSVANVVDPDVDPMTLYRRLAEVHRTFVVPGSTFELPDASFRLGFGADPADLAEALKRLGVALAECRTGGERA